MLNLTIGFVLGAIVMDFLWAWRLGMPQAMWRRVRARKQSDARGTDVQ